MSFFTIDEWGAAAANTRNGSWSTKWHSNFEYIGWIIRLRDLFIGIWNKIKNRESEEGGRAESGDGEPLFQMASCNQYSTIYQFQMQMRWNHSQLEKSARVVVEASSCVKGMPQLYIDSFN